MNPTHEPDHNPAQPRPFGENFLADLLTDPDRFRTWVASATGTASRPVPGPDTNPGLEQADSRDADDTFTVTATGLRALDEAPAAEAPGNAAVVLRSAADYLTQHGWIQGAYYDATTGSFTPPSCLVGAIGMVCYGGPVDAPAQHFDDPGYLDFEEAVLHLDRFLLVEDGSVSYEFNDARGRTVEQVTDVLRQAAARPDDDLLDAIRVIDAHNADMAALAQLVTPRGVWANPNIASGSDGQTSRGVDGDCCQVCGATGEYPFCTVTTGGRTACADVAANEWSQRGARDGDPA
jgi:hypothetical protein